MMMYFVELQYNIKRCDGLIALLTPNNVMVVEHFAQYDMTVILKQSQYNIVYRYNVTVI